MGIGGSLRNAFKVGRLIFGSQAQAFASLQTVAGVPVNGTSGTLAGFAQPGSLLVDTTNKEFYRNVGTQASPIWGCLSRLMTAFARYNFAVDGGAQGAITATVNSTIPDNAIIINAVINSTTAVTSNGSATVAIGTSAGSSATAILAATGKASFSADALVQGVPVPSDATKFVKMTAAGSVTFTVGTADLTAGVIEVTLEYVLARA